MKKIIHYAIMLLVLIKAALLMRPPSPSRGKTVNNPSVSAKSSEEGSSRNQRKVKAKPNQYKQYTALTDLVQKRPQQGRDTRPFQYAEAFAVHPDIAPLQLDNLDHEGKMKLAKDTMNLRDLQQNPAWQRKYTLSLRTHFENANIDEKTQNDVLGYHVSARLKKKDRNRRIQENNDTEGIQRKKEQSKYYYERSKESKKRVRDIRNAFIEDLDKIIGSRTKLSSTSEVQKQAEQLREKYPDEKVFGACLISYLMKKKYPADEIALMRGSSYMIREKERLAKFHAKRWALKKQTASTSASKATSVEQESQYGEQQKDKGKRIAGEEVVERTTKRVKVVADRGEHLESSTDDVGSSSSSQRTGNPMSPAKDAPTTSSSTQPKADKDVNELECGSWWEGGCFDD